MKKNPHPLPFRLGLNILLCTVLLQVLTGAGFAQTTNLVLSLDGTSGYVSVPSSPDLQNPTNITVEAWINPKHSTAYKGSACFIDKGDNQIYYSQRSYEIDWITNQPGKGVLVVQLFLNTDTWAEIGAILSESNWVHVAFTYSSSNGLFQLFTNGVLAATTNYDVNGTIPLAGQELRQTTLPLNIGGQQIIEGPVFAGGYMDEVRVWETARTQAEIAGSRFLRLSGSEPNLAGYWNFDNGTATDLTSNGNNGTFQGTAQAVPIVGTDTVHGGISINTQPVSSTNSIGSSVIFSVTASAQTPLNYQWQKNGANLSDQTNSALTLSGLQYSDVGIYSVIVSNAGSSVISSNAVLAVFPPHTSTGVATMAGGFVVGVSVTDGGGSYTNTPLVRLIGGGGSGAGAYAVVSNGVVTSVTVTNAGFGYSSAPLVVIEPPFILNPILGIAPLSFFSFSNLTTSAHYQLQQKSAWYWVNQPVNFTATNSLYTQMVAGVWGSGDFRLALNPVPAQAFASAQVVNGFVVGATVIAGGAGYVTTPNVNITGDAGSNALAVANIVGGVVTGISIVDAGGGYTNRVTVQIDPPPAAAVFPTIQPVMRVDSASLAPYDNYQIQFKTDIGGTWGNWNGGLFVPTAVTNSQYLFITNGTGYFRLQYVP